MNKFNHKEVEVKWQKKWAKDRLYEAKIDKNNKYYNLWMFPYPSGEGLHAGHAFASTGSDIYGRYMRMRGKNVFQPIGYDSFGIHSENYAIKVGKHPKNLIDQTTKNYERQMRSLGHGYDWKRTVTTSDINYYKWTQWLFVEMFKTGLAYRASAKVNWCPSCKTVLADEQVTAEECERCGTKVEQKDLEQWFLRITQYADRLLYNLSKIDWSKRVVTAQRNWIGRSHGHEIKFSIFNSQFSINVFTTRLDTINGATFIAVSPESELAGKLKGKYAINPANGRKIPIYTADYVLADYGTGIIMGVPKDDARDAVFAKKHKLPIISSYTPKNLQNKLIKDGIAKKKTTYHLRDWLISRQRYWGPPIPMIYCKTCAEAKRSHFTLKDQSSKVIRKDQNDWNHYGWWPSKIPVELPHIDNYKPKGEGRGPLEDHSNFYNTVCPYCGKKAKRETDVSDTFLDSSWYFLRYPSVKNPKSEIRNSKQKLPWDSKITKHWLPVDLYFGGPEHSVLHLMYARFVTMALHDIGYLEFDEPFSKLFAHGHMIKDGAKMSKSRGNTVNPDEYWEKYGADAFRMYLMFLGPMDGSPDFRDSGMEGMRRFVDRVWNIVNSNSKNQLPTPGVGRQIDAKMHKTIIRVTEDIENMRFNTAIAGIMEYTNSLKLGASKENLKVLVQLIAPFAPHMAEEVWVNVLGQKYSVHTGSWPEYDSKMTVEDNVVIPVQVNGKLRTVLRIKNNESRIKQKVVRRAKENQKISKWLKDKKIKKIIFIPDKLINFVV